MLSGGACQRHSAAILASKYSTSLKFALAPEVKVGAEDTRQNHGGASDLFPTPAGVGAAAVFAGRGSEGETLDGGDVLGRGQEAYGHHDHRRDQRDENAEVLKVEIIDDPKERSGGIAVLKSLEAQRHRGIDRHPKQAKRKADDHGP